MGLGVTVVGPSGSREFKWEAIQLSSSDGILSRYPKTLSDGRRSLCLGNLTRDAFCLFETPTLLSLVSVEEGCGAGGVDIPPKECYSFVSGKDP
jgi:hypothetical protein